SCIFGWPLFEKKEINLRNIIIGIALAILLYIIFWTGNKFIIFLSSLKPGLVPERIENLNSIYANRGMFSSYVISALLFFPIGFGEEIFWRGFIQRFLTGKWNPLVAITVTTFLYVMVHVPTGNPILILAAFTCGLFWGSSYRLSGSIIPVLVSHMVWDPFIFVIMPIK
ncbi:MAG: hypothetical protein A2161_06665, partial [Candidatus Schekmanbacteria bacterium RBG_13_48_7]